jgi:hypothetical protein
VQARSCHQTGSTGDECVQLYLEKLGPSWGCPQCILLDKDVRWVLSFWCIFHNLSCEQTRVMRISNDFCPLWPAGTRSVSAERISYITKSDEDALTSPFFWSRSYTSNRSL